MVLSFVTFPSFPFLPFSSQPTDTTAAQQSNQHMWQKNAFYGSRKTKKIRIICVPLLSSSQVKYRNSHRKKYNRTTAVGGRQKNQTHLAIYSDACGSTSKHAFFVLVDHSPDKIVMSLHMYAHALVCCLVVLVFQLAFGSLISPYYCWLSCVIHTHVKCKIPQQNAHQTNHHDPDEPHLHWQWLEWNLGSLCVSIYLGNQWCV